MSDFLLIPQKLPRRSQRWALRALALFGWNVHFAPLPGPRGVLIVYPHTSNWDFLIGLLYKVEHRLPVQARAIEHGVVESLKFFHDSVEILPWIDAAAN